MKDDTVIILVYTVIIPVNTVIIPVYTVIILVYTVIIPVYTFILPVNTVIIPVLTDISPIAQVALLQTEMCSGVRLAPRTGMKSAVQQKIIINQINLQQIYAVKVTSFSNERHVQLRGMRMW